VTPQFPEYFALFGIPARFAIDSGQLTRAYREVLTQVHPDRYAGAGPAERRAAMQMASHANEAYDVLRSDCDRAAYLCRQQGMVVDGAGAVPLAPDFLERQMQWHEQLDAARGRLDDAAMAALAQDVDHIRRSTVARIAHCIDDAADYPAAAAAVRALMFLEKLGGDIARAAAERNDAAASGK
jgi:molecular chaperone HscB